MAKFRRTRSFWQEFKTFAFKGNMIDLAVAVVIGAAFSGVINALVKDIIMPSISYVTTAAGSAARAASDVAHQAGEKTGLTSRPATTEPTTEAAAAPAPTPAPAAAPPAPAPSDQRPVDITWTIGRIKIGDFIGELINFILVAFAVFVTIVKLLGSVVKRVGGTPAPSEPTTKECPYCLSVIPLKARKCSFCTADLPDANVVNAPPAAAP